MILETLYNCFDLGRMIGSFPLVVGLGYLVVRVTDNSYTRKIKEDREREKEKKLRKLLSKHGIRNF